LKVASDELASASSIDQWQAALELTLAEASGTTRPLGDDHRHAVDRDGER
jgi:hypothetical protein